MRGRMSCNQKSCAVMQWWCHFYIISYDWASHRETSEQSGARAQSTTVGCSNDGDAFEPKVIQTKVFGRSVTDHFGQRVIDNFNRRVWQSVTDHLSQRCVHWWFSSDFKHAVIFLKQIPDKPSELRHSSGSLSVADVSSLVCWSWLVAEYLVWTVLVGW